MEHVTDEQAAKLASGQLGAVEWQRIARHLLTGCGVCRERLSTLVIEGSCEIGPVDESAYDAAVDRAINRVKRREVPRWRRERAQLERLLAAARDCPQGIIGLKGKARRDMHGWPLVEALLQVSQAARFRDPREMLDLAFAAHCATMNLPVERYGPAFVADLRAWAWGELANAYRVNEDADAAERALARAISFRLKGTGDPSLLARLLDVEASLRSDQRRLPEALEALALLHRIYLEIGETHLAGRALIKTGINTHFDGRAQEAVALLRQGLAMLDRDRDPQLLPIGRQGLLHALVDCGEFREASQLLLESGLRQAFASEPINLLKLRGVEGKILAGLGKLRRAEAVFQRVREGFLGFELEYEAALVGLELAAVWLRQGRTAELRQLAEEILETFEDLGVHREALRAARYLHEACRRERATLTLLHATLDFLRRLEWQPQLRFQPG